MGKMKELDIEMKNNTYTFADCFSLNDYWGIKCVTVAKPVQVIYNPPYTIVNFDDGSKSISKIHNEDFDFEKGLMAAIVKRVVSRADFERLMNQGSKSFENKQKKECNKKE
jgi:hypothetical protein